VLTRAREWLSEAAELQERSSRVQRSTSALASLLDLANQILDHFDSKHSADDRIPIPLDALNDLTHPPCRFPIQRRAISPTCQRLATCVRSVNRFVMRSGDPRHHDCRRLTYNPTISEVA
jgi:hypothetical protein